MVIDSQEIPFHNASGGFNVQLVHWVCPICGMEVSTKISQKDFERLSVDELKKIMEKVGSRRIAEKHKCKFVPIWYEEGGYIHGGIEIRGKAKGNN